MSIPKKVVVIGAGFAGLSVATSLADKGYQVTVLEKNPTPGGRARIFQQDGFTFDMGPSWYWMPDVFETYFERFGKKTADYYDLIRLDPSYTVIFDENNAIPLPTGIHKIQALFETIEPGSARRLMDFLNQAAYKYHLGMHKFAWKPSRYISEFISLKTLVDVVQLDIFQSFSSHVRKYFSDKRLLKLMEFPILFLGATPQNTPALYSLMNYAEMSMGTWYPMGGMYQLVRAMVNVAQEKGVEIVYNHPVSQINVIDGIARKVITRQGEFDADIVVSGADYQHVDSKLLSPEYRNYTDDYWNKRTLAPSSLLFYLGVSRKVPRLQHHNLFFDEDFNVHAHEIYDAPRWPTRPLFYVSTPSKTDPSVAPDGMENLFILIPVAPNLNDPEEIRESYYHLVMERIERYVGAPIRPHVIFKRSYAHSNFIADYNAFRGNAYGLANTLWQTAILKPSLKNKKVANLYYTGQLTVPGPGVPPSLISGLVVAEEIEKEFS